MPSEKETRYVVDGDYTYSTYDISWFKTEYNATVHCVDCDISRSNEFYTNYSQVPLPKNPSTFYVNSSKQHWMDDCTYVYSDDYHNQIYGIHYGTASTYDSTLLFYFTIFQYLGLAVIFSNGRPFREPMYKNYWLALCLVALGAFILCVMIWEPHWATDLLELIVLPEKSVFYKWMAIIVPTNFVVSWAIEQVINRIF